MRFDTPVYFQTIQRGAYDPATGDYAEDTVEETMRYASVMDTQKETLRLIFGEIRQGSKTVILQYKTDASFRPDRIRIGNEVYSIEYRRRLRVKETFIVSEVQK